MPDGLFWRSTPREVHALMNRLADQRSDDRRAADMRAGLVAATIVNWAGKTRKRSAKDVQPEDFFRKGPEIVSPEEMEFRLDAWAAANNRRVRA